MRAETRQEFIPFMSRHEPLVPWMYLNPQGQVVVGLSACLLEPIDRALQLPWQRRDLPGEVGMNEISADWVRVKKNRLLAHKGPGGSAPYTQLLLSQHGLEDLILGRMDAVELMVIRPSFRTWEQWPWQAQLAALSMGWLEPNLPEIFPKWSKAARNHNWKVCAQQCSFATANRPELVARNWAHRKLFVDAMSMSTKDDGTEAKGKAIDDATGT
jgi:hypothetical protein